MAWERIAPMVDDPQERAFWEPWQPQLGQRVRVRLNGECRIGGARIEWGNARVVTHGVGEPDWMNGVVGEVKPCLRTGAWRCDTFPGHPYYVYLRTPDGQLWGAHLAAIELEPA